VTSERISTARPDLSRVLEEAKGAAGSAAELPESVGGPPVV